VKKAEKDRLDDRLKFERELFLELVKHDPKNEKNNENKDSDNKKIIYDRK